MLIYFRGEHCGRDGKIGKGIVSPATAAARAMTRYSRRRADGIVEYHSSEADLERAALRETERAQARFFALLGLLAGGVLSYLAVKSSDAAYWPKWARFVCIAAGAGTAAFVLARLAQLIVMLLGLLLLGAVAAIVIGIIWSAV
jgi:hypothetical protein